MSIYDIDFSQSTTELLPPSKRTSRTEAFLSLAGLYLQFLHDIIFNTYQNGSIYPLFDNGSPYFNGDRVMDDDNGVYEVIDESAFALSGGFYTHPFTNPSMWVRLTKDWRGTSARIRYNSQKLVLEWVLNEYFGQVFRQPNDVTFSGTKSDIYVEDVQNYNPFFIAQDDVHASFAVDIPSTIQDFIIDDNSASVYISRKIYVKAAWWATFNSSGDGDEKMRSFIDKYIIAGCVYQILTY